MQQEVGPNDRVFFYFAGHGIALDGDDGPEGYLVPEDAKRDDRTSFLGMTELHDSLAKLPCRHLLVILDCCFAGAFRWSSTRDISALPSVIHRERFERYIHDPAWQVLTSAAHDQTALDVLSGNTIGERIESDAHSPFAAALFRSGWRGGSDSSEQGRSARRRRRDNCHRTVSLLARMRGDSNRGASHAPDSRTLAVEEARQG